jgi:hypothetical protein
METAKEKFSQKKKEIWWTFFTSVRYPECMTVHFFLGIGHFVSFRKHGDWEKFHLLRRLLL